MPYRFFDHTGDFGAELEADSAEGVIEASARALVALLTDGAELSAEEEREVALDALDHADLMVALGNELLFLLEVEGWLAARVEVSELSEDTLEAVAHGAPHDPARHPIARPIKAVTHHDARVERAEEGWRGRLIFDL